MIWGSGIDRTFIALYIMLGLCLVGLIYESTITNYNQQNTILTLQEKIKEFEKVDLGINN